MTFYLNLKKKTLSTDSVYLGDCDKSEVYILFYPCQKPVINCDLILVFHLEEKKPLINIYSRSLQGKKKDGTFFKTKLM